MTLLAGKTFEPLIALLSLPMQRLPRYILLLQELRKQTEKFNPGHDDLGNLQMAIKGIKDVTATVSFFKVFNKFPREQYFIFDF